MKLHIERNKRNGLTAVMIAVSAIIIIAGLAVLITPKQSSDFSSATFGTPPNYISIQPDGTVIFHGGANIGSNMPMNHYYLTEMDYCHWITFSLNPGVTDVTINIVPPGVLEQDRYYHRLTFAVDKAPGHTQTCSLSLTNGVYNMEVVLSGSETTSGYTTDNSFAWDASEETLTLQYTQSAAGQASVGFVTVKYHYKEND